jgi:hypothetical protein
MVEDITKGVFTEIHADNLEDVFKQQSENMEILRADLQDFVEKLEGMRTEGIFDDRVFQNIQDLNDAIFEMAFLDAVESIQDKALNFLVTEAVRAVVSTQDFNYDLYTKHLLSAMEANQEKIITILPRKKERAVEVKVNLDILGKAEDWGKAIEDYRKKKKLGKSRGQTGEHGEMSSYFWKEKYYGAGRQGTRVEKIRKRKNIPLLRTRKAKKTRRPFVRDVTDKYKNKYRETIAGRLSEISGGKSKAPFWHLIEKGNANPADVDLGLEDADGVPYPVFGPTNFRRNSEETIARAFSQIWQEYWTAARNFVRQLLEERTPRDGGIIEREPTEEEIQAVERYHRTRRSKIRGARTVRGRVRGKIRRKEELAPTGKIQAFIDTQHGRFEAYLQGETIRVSLRDPKSGRFIALPWEDLDDVSDLYGIK